MGQAQERLILEMNVRKLEVVRDMRYENPTNSKWLSALSFVVVSSAILFLRFGTWSRA